MKNNLVIPLIIAAIIFGGGGFFGGMKYQQSKRMQPIGGQFNRQNGPGGNRQTSMPTDRQGFRPVAGEIVSVDDTSMTVKMMDGSSKIILLTEKTTINKSSEGSKVDLTAGEQVSIFGSENSDGSVTAQNVQLGSPRMPPVN